jgi:cob(I)alamin adenosyltransferase
LVGMALTYAKGNRIDKATRSLAQIDAILPPGGAPAADLVAELQQARELVRKAESRSSITGTGNE